MASYLPGQVATLTATFRDGDGELADPTTVTLAVMQPDGVALSPVPSPTGVSTGVYEADILLGMAGVWYYTFTGSGVFTAIDQGTLVVRETHADLLTVEQLREHVVSNLGDDALQRILDANEDAITEFVGPIRPFVEIHDGRTASIALARRAASITSIVERHSQTDTTLAADDYRIRAAGYVLERTSGGTNSRTSWNDLVTVTYVPVSDVAERIRVLIALCKLDLAHEPGLASKTVVDWTESYGGSGYLAERGSMLASLRQPSMIVV